MRKYTNNTGISLPMAVWLASDNYDGRKADNPYFLSATSLLKSPRQIVLGMRAQADESLDEIIDVASVIKSKIGTAIHDSIEAAWTADKLSQVLIALGYPEEAVGSLKVNPTAVSTGDIPVYMEQRTTKAMGKWLITGKYDFILLGKIYDFKSTGTFTYVNETKSDDYSKQGSIYRWLNPDKIQEDKISIEFIFTDWKQNMVGQGNYPPGQILSKEYPLMPIQETENWIKDRLTLIETLELSPETELPLCTDTELWRRNSVWKYYKSGQVTARSTRNFDNSVDAYNLQTKDGGTGLVMEIKGQPTACLYCNVSALCSQKDGFIASGDLVI